MEKNCMVTSCKDEGTHFVFDGNFWIKVCKEHYSEFKQFARENKLVFKEKELPVEVRKR